MAFCAFSRARAILNESTTDGEPATKRAKTIPSIALTATRASSALELSEDGTKIRRAQPYVEVNAKELAARTVYVEPVADDASIDSIQARFAPHGAVANVSLPRGRGFGFVEFERRESAQKAVAALDGSGGAAVLRLETAALIVSVKALPVDATNCVEINTVWPGPEK